MNGAGKRGYCREEVPPHPSPRPHSQESSFRLSSVGNHHLTLEKLPLAAEWKTGRGAKRGEQQNQSRCGSSSSGIQVTGASQTRVGTWRRREGAFRLCLQVGPTLLLLDRPLGVWWDLAATPTPPSQPLHLCPKHNGFCVENLHRTCTLRTDLSQNTQRRHEEGIIMP